jgi:hypothetical protein
MNQAAEVGDASSDTSDIDKVGSSKAQSESDWDDDVISLGSPFASTPAKKDIKKDKLITADNVHEYIYISSNSNSSDDGAGHPRCRNDVLSQQTQLEESLLPKECNSELTRDNKTVSEGTFAKQCDQPTQSACIDSSVGIKRQLCADPDTENDDFSIESETKVESPPSLLLSSKSSSYVSSVSSTNESSNKSTLGQSHQPKTLDKSKVKGSKKYTDSVQETKGGVDRPSGASREHSAGVTGTSDVHIDKRLKPTPFQMVLRRRRTEDTIKNKQEEAKVILKGMGRGRGKHFER